jgi:hypothetical protein
MYHTTRIVLLITASFILVAVPVLAEETTFKHVVAPATQSGKDLCLLAEPGSCDRVWTMTGKINTIENEIKKGKSVYTSEELNILHKRLDDANSEMIENQKGGW